MIGERLTPQRDVQLHAAYDRMIDGRDTGDDAAYDAATWDVIKLSRRLWAEQLAEHGQMPATVDGCIAALDVAARIIRVIGQERPDLLEPGQAAA